MSKWRARALRRNATEAERILWRLLRPLRSEGIHFRRQVRLGRYYVDFACHHARLAIELDGEHHGTDRQRLYDQEREAALHGYGYQVLRFANHDIFTNRDAVSRAIFDALRDRRRTPRFSNGNGGDTDQ